MMGRICLVEPFYSGSHKRWADEFISFSSRPVDLITLPGKNWKWRMASGAIPIAQKIVSLDAVPSVFLISGMVDLPLLQSLLRTDYAEIPFVLYLHENQLTYPWNDEEYREADRQYAWRNLTSMLVADKVIFNSDFHREEVVKAIPEFLKAFPNNGYQSSFKNIKTRSHVLEPGVNFKEILSIQRIDTNQPRILWNHRWEHDKNPGEFIQLLRSLRKDDVEFELVVCGERTNQSLEIDQLQVEFADCIAHWGYAESRTEYLNLIRSCCVLPVTSKQEFFGLSVMEAAVAGVTPILPERLAYPSIYSGLNVFYQSFDELKSKVKRALKDNKSFTLPGEFDRYDWRNLIKRYESLLLNSK